jgi:hypothetical protein
MAGTQLPAIVRVSVWVFRFLLYAYPAAFRHDYAAEMERTFRVQCQVAYHQAGSLGVVRLWPATLVDWLYALVGERLADEDALAQAESLGSVALNLRAGGTRSYRAVAAASALAFASVLYSFARYPSGLAGDTPADLALLAIELACYTVGAWYLTGALAPGHRCRATACGLGIGAIWLAYTVVANLTDWGPMIYHLVVVATLYGSLALMFLAGHLTFHATGRYSTGMCAGIWAGMVGALTGVLGGGPLTYPFMDRVLSLNLHDPGFLRSGMHDVAAWTVQDSLGGALFLLVLGPLFGTLLGSAGWLAARARLALWRT